MTFRPGPRDVADIQKMIIKQGKRNVVFRVVHAGGDKAKIAVWRLSFLRILGIFNVRFLVLGRLSLTTCF